MLGLRRSKGRGTKLWAGCITVSNAETLNTGLDHIEGAAFTTVEATDVDAATTLAWIDSHSGGTITFQVAEIATYGNSTDSVVYGVVVGRVD